MRPWTREELLRLADDSASQFLEWDAVYDRMRARLIDGLASHAKAGAALSAADVVALASSLAHDLLFTARFAVARRLGEQDNEEGVKG